MAELNELLLSLSCKACVYCQFELYDFAQVRTLNACLWILKGLVAVSYVRSPFVELPPTAVHSPFGEPTVGELNQLLLSLSRKAHTYCQVACFCALTRRT